MNPNRSTKSPRISHQKSIKNPQESHQKSSKNLQTHEIPKLCPGFSSIFEYLPGKIPKSPGNVTRFSDFSYLDVLNRRIRRGLRSRPHQLSPNRCRDRATMTWFEETGNSTTIFRMIFERYLNNMVYI